MALKSTIFKVELKVADIERNYYADHSLTIARHPSETDERMMLRVLAFALNAGTGLTFGKGLSTDDEPDLWQRDLTGRIGSGSTSASPTRSSCAAPAGAPMRSSSTRTAVARTSGGAAAGLRWSGRRTSP